MFIELFEIEKIQLRIIDNNSTKMDNNTVFFND